MATAKSGSTDDSIVGNRAPERNALGLPLPLPTLARMPTRRFDAILSDIDGCLGPESAAPMETSKLAEVEAWNRAAIATNDRPVLTLCSGRPQPYAEAMCRIIGNS